MPVLSAVLTLPAGDERQKEIVAALAVDARVSVGDTHGCRLPIVLATDDHGEDRDLWEWATTLPGVLHAELVFADFSDLVQSWSTP